MTTNGTGAEEKIPAGEVAAEISRFISELGDPKLTTIKLFRGKPNVLSDGTKCSGWMTNIKVPEELEEERIQEEFGGGDFYVSIYRVGEKGVRRRVAFDIGGAPRMPAHLLDAKAAENFQKYLAGGTAPGHAADVALGGKALDASIRNNERHSRERELRDAEIRKLIQEGAEAKAQAAALLAQMAELRARPAEMLAIKTVEKDMTAIALHSIQQGAKDQAEAHARELASLRAGKHEEQAPMRQYLNDVAKQQEMAIKSMADNYKFMMDIQQQSSNMMIESMRSQNESARAMLQSQLDSVRADLREMRNNKDTGVLGDFDKLTTAIEKIMKISGKLESEPKDIGSQIMAAITGLIETAPELVKNLKSNPGAPSGQLPQQQQQQAQQQQQQQRVESDREAALLLQTLRDAYAKRMPVEDLARTVSSRIGTGGVASLLTQPPDTLVAAIQAQVAELSSPEGGQYLRDLRVALTLL